MAQAAPIATTVALTAPTTVAIANTIVVPIEVNCSICADKYTPIIRKRIPCKYCAKDTCSKCIEQYLLTRSDEPHCIHCKVHYNDKDLHTICTKTYLKDRFFKHRQEVLISRERANLPGLQDAANRIKRARDRELIRVRITKELNELIEIRNALRHEQIRLEVLPQRTEKETEQMTGMMMELDEYGKTIAIKKQELFESRIIVYHEDQEMKSADDEKADERKKFIRRCVRSNCNGFLSTAWKCGLCDWYSCSKCFTERGPEHDTPHECKKDDLDTAELIRKDSKPCPNCGEFINKSSGCFALNTPILTWNGTVKMSQDIRVGDELVGDDATKRTVLSLVSGEDMMYEVTQNNGLTYVVNSKHTLVLQITQDCDHDEIKKILGVFPQPDDFPCIVHIVVDEYIKLPLFVQQQLIGYKSSQIKSEISVKPIGQGEYYGWSVDANKRFLLADTTVLRNCNQMYCVSCQTPFDWITLKIVTSGAIHNPHYYEMMKRKGALPRNPGDVPCGGFPTRWQLVAHPHGVLGYVSDHFYEFHRLCEEAQEMSRRSYRAHIDNTTTHDINIKYLLGDFDDVKWGRLLATNEKKRKRDAEVQEVFAAFLMVAVNIVNTVQNYYDEKHGYFNALPPMIAEQILMDLDVEITELLSIMNSAFRDISIAYSYSVPTIETQMVNPERNLLIYRLVVKSFTKRATKKADSDEDD